MTDKMSDLDAIMILEADGEGDPIDAMQQLIDSGTVWHLQGSYQRAAHAMIESGFCTPKEN
jgi:hypothetical protein